MEAKDRDEFRSEFHVKLECRVINYYFVIDEVTGMATRGLSFLVKEQILFLMARSHLRL